MRKIKLDKEVNLTAKFDAFPYQKEAFDAIKDLDYAAVFHEQGLGKTKIAIDLLLYWLANTSIDTVLIVTKKQLVPNWIREFKVHTSIKPQILTTNKDNNYYVFCGTARVVITNFEVLVSEKNNMILFLKTRNVGVIIDESTKLKNPNTKLTQTFFELSNLFAKRVIMTGTPVANRPYDIWAQIYFLDHGQSLGESFTEFKKATDLSNELENHIQQQEEFEKTISKIFNKIKGFSVREIKNNGIIALPNKVYIQERTDFSIEQKEFYERIRKEQVLEIQKDKHWIFDDSSAAVKRLLRLVQATSNPRLIDCSFVGRSAKETLLDEIIKRILSKEEKCIVWSLFTDNIDYFTQKYRKYGSVKIHGKMSMEDRNSSVERFGTEDYKIMFATPASAKEGLTLTMANHVIFYDRGFSLDDYLQSQDRIHRISQTKTCYIHNMIINGSIDEWIDVLLSAKQRAASLTQGDISIYQYETTVDYSFGSLIKDILFPEDDLKGEN